MTPEYVRRLYDRAYAEKYNEKFLFSDLAQADAKFELEYLRGMLVPPMRWLDVACGTGYFLSQFPDMDRAGLDVSADMIELAKRENPGVPFHCQSFLFPMPEWNNQWDLVSCMWYAYGLVESMNEVETLIDNLARWTSPSGALFLPLADPELIAGTQLPYKIRGPWPGEGYLTGLLWSYAEEGGQKVHSHQIAPHVELMMSMLGKHFDHIDLVRYPPAKPGWEGVRRAAVATGKRNYLAASA